MASGDHDRRRGRRPSGPAARDFTADAPASKLVGDITYIGTCEGWLYLATVLDYFSRKVVGYAMGEHMLAELVAPVWQQAMSRFDTAIPFSTATAAGQYPFRRIRCRRRAVGCETLRWPYPDVPRQ